MNDGLKQRLVGAVVLAALAIIFLPSVLRDQQPEPVDTRTQIPARPNIEPMTFSAPEQPADIEPAPNPDTMFVPQKAEQPVVDDMSEAQNAEPENAAPQDAEQGDTAHSEPVVEANPEAEPESKGEAAAGAWVVQVASFTSADAAATLRDRLQEKGYKAYVRSAMVNDNEVSRVYIGPKLNRDAAREIKSAVDRELRVEALVLRFQP